MALTIQLMAFLWPLVLRHAIALPNTTPLEARATCKYVMSGSGDSCWSIATQRCSPAISVDDIIKFNGGSKFCDGLQPNMAVCCTSGTPPDLSPQPNPDGSCFVYTIQPKDTCLPIANKYFTTPQQIEANNKETWGFTDCNGLMPGMKICLSKGSPPMPNQIDGVVCGPQKVGTQRPTNGTKLADLNPCPLNACCDKWGQCGVTDEFCTDTRKDGAAPGTSAPNTNGCISNCGTKIINNSQKPDSFASVAYFEGWNYDRDCLHMTPDQIDTTKYTHIHFAFGGITPDFKVNISNSIGFQHEIFVRATGIKRVLSFGGWSFSTEGDTWPIFRSGVTDANRATFATNVVDFLKLNNLDGLDFDWEYPGEPDIPGLPPGGPDDGKNYLAFLKLVKSKLPAGKTLSIAAPASFWYLKQFPIKEISDVVDYIVYMTYDLHGQWDAGNKYANPGCDSGNCLRSHVNLTETNYALSMVTKAGVPAKKIFVGVASYGRSFKMAKAGCKTEECKFLGDATNSPAAKGLCTKTSGYIAAAEIRDIIRKGRAGESDYTINDAYYDQKTDSDILVYNNDEWVAYMSDNTKKSRTEYYKNLNFGGVSDWAVDLWNDGLDPDDPSGGDRNLDDNFLACDVSRVFKTLDDIQKDSSIPIYCRGFYTLTVLLRQLEQAKIDYDDVNDGYDKLFGYYSKYYHELVTLQIQDCTSWTKGGGPCLKYMSCTWAENGASNGGVTTGCPVPNHQPNAEDFFTVTYAITDETNFYKTLDEKYGILKEWIQFGSRDQIVTCRDLPPGSDCSPIARHWRNEPQAKPDFVTPNPKDVIGKAGGGLEVLTRTVAKTLVEWIMGDFPYDGRDIAYSLELPTALIRQAIDGMEQAKKIGETQEKEKKKQMILTIVQSIIFALPFAGEAGVLFFGAVNVAKYAALLATTADVAFATYQTVEDPTKGPLAFLGVMITKGARNAFYEFHWTEAALGLPRRLTHARAHLDPIMLTRLGALFAEDEKKMQSFMPWNQCPKV